MQIPTPPPEGKLQEQCSDTHAVVHSSYVGSYRVRAGSVSKKIESRQIVVPVKPTPPDLPQHWHDAFRTGEYAMGGRSVPGGTERHAHHVTSLCSVRENSGTTPGSGDLHHGSISSVHTWSTCSASVLKTLSS